MTASGTVADAEGTSGADTDALLARAVGAIGGHPREGQVAMAHAVADALAASEHALVQAGTGTGKSLGYLVPAVAHAVRTGGRVIVSTATLALQRQIFTKDLPLVAAALEPVLGEPVRIALFKGRANYLCVHKMGAATPSQTMTCCRSALRANWAARSCASTSGPTRPTRAIATTSCPV
ncbi:hypothetical protein GCM10025873_11720 [Demequina sediminis]|uniref:DEAD/DEAH box helicase n=1 Tax=Demequina sediminis TaxID=1930058 RepID=UPI003305FBB3|nr:hypothetical protein GCM10025873_11720 [Demequina sediminis]